MLFLDASYIIALADPQDPWHDAAKGLVDLVESRQAHTHALALAEAIAAVGSRLGGRVAREIYEAVHDDTRLHLPSQDDLDRSMVLVVRYDGTLSLSDAYALLVVEREGLDGIVSFDDDFDKAGVRRLGGEG